MKGQPSAFVFISRKFYERPRKIGEEYQHVLCVKLMSPSPSWVSMWEYSCLVVSLSLGSSQLLLSHSVVPGVSPVRLAVGGYSHITAQLSLWWELKPLWLQQMPRDTRHILLFVFQCCSVVWKGHGQHSTIKMMMGVGCLTSPRVHR